MKALLERRAALAEAILGPDHDAARAARTVLGRPASMVAPAPPTIVPARRTGRDPREVHADAARIARELGVSPSTMPAAASRATAAPGPGASALDRIARELRVDAAELRAAVARNSAGAAARPHRSPPATARRFRETP
jgi:DNA-binding transcriptional regulator YdaS (Cro superfamily)